MPGGQAQAQVRTWVAGTRMALPFRRTCRECSVAEAGNDGAAILLGEVGEQDGVVRLAAPQHTPTISAMPNASAACSELLALRQIADVLQHLGKG
jgi:threonine dehydrogenase-like Zn-dependent dehydrogenase